MSERFSKKVVAEIIGRGIGYREQKFGFHDRTGYAQVTGKGEEINRAYGEYHMLIDLADLFDLDHEVVFAAAREIREAKS